MSEVENNHDCGVENDEEKFEVGTTVDNLSSPALENPQNNSPREFAEQDFLADLSASDEEEVSEVESFILDQDFEDSEQIINSSKFLLSPENLEGTDLRTVDPETQAKLEALLEAAGIGKLSTPDGKSFADQEVLWKLTSSVSCALDEAAAALTRMRAEQQGQLTQGERSLAEACSDGDIGAVRKLLDEGRSVHETTKEGESLLSLACSAGYYELAQVLLAMRANVEDRGVKGDCTPLMEAANGGYGDMVKLLLAHGADVNAQSSSGKTPLHYAAEGGFEDVVHVLIAANANVEEHNENGHTPLMEAASAGHVGVAKILLEAGAGINTHSNEFKESALTLASYKGHLEMVKFLLDAGADHEHKTDEMHTALMEASMDGHVEVARLLLDRGAQVNMPADSFESPLTLAACGGHVELANLLIGRGANLEEVNDEGYTPLMEAAREGHEEMVVQLLAHGANVNAQTEETQETALTLAACGGCLEVVDFLVQADADIEMGCSTPLMEASQEGHLEVVKFLLKQGANVHAQTGSGDTALTYACENGHTDVADILLQHGAELEHESEGGRTPLMKAARAGHLCTVQFLISKNAEVNRATTSGDHTVLSLACAGGYLSVVETLLAHGADPTSKLKDGSTMLIEAAKGGHTNVVNLLLDWPNQSLQAASTPPELVHNSMHESPRVPVQGLNNATLTKEAQQMLNYPGDPQGHINLADLNVPLHTQEMAGKKRSRAMRTDPDGHTDSTDQDNFSDNEEFDEEYERNYTETGSPVPFDGEDRPDLKASERLEAFINKMMRKAELLNTTREEQILKKQQILEELQKVERELHEKAQTQLLINAQQRLEQQQRQQLQQQHQQEQLLQQQKEYYQYKLQELRQQYQQKQLQLQQHQQQLEAVQRQQKEEKKRKPIPLHIALHEQLQAKIEGKVVELPPGFGSEEEGLLSESDLLALQDMQDVDVLVPLDQELPVSVRRESHELVQKLTENGQTVQTLATTTSDSDSSRPALLHEALKNEMKCDVSSDAHLHLQNILSPEIANREKKKAKRSLPQYDKPTQVCFEDDLKDVMLKGDDDQSQTTEEQRLRAKLMLQKELLKLQQQQLQQQALQNKNKQLKQQQNFATNLSAPTSSLESLTPSSSTPLTPNPSPAISPPSYPLVDLDAETESNHDTALTLACAGGHADLVSLLLGRNAEIEHRDKKGFTPLILAATAGHAVVVEILLDHGADIEAQSERTKDTPLSLACSGGRYEVVELLLARGANKEHRNVSDYTPLSLAASGGYVNIIKLLLSHGAEINSRTGSKLGISPLMLAAMNGHTQAVKLLLDMGSDINAQIETNRNTALTLACFQGRHEVVSLLVDRKANIEHRAKTGLTPLMEAASGGYVEVGRVLLDKGADVNAPPVPSSRDTALTIAADKGHYRFVELLLSRNAAVDVKNKKGNSPLWLACNGGHLDVVQLLVSAGADIDSQDNRKVSCLMAAFRKGHVKVVKWMVKHVNQFPSDPECMRFIQTITDKEILKKCHQCMDIIVHAKDRQAAEANKNASFLLEQLEREKTQEESKKAAAARKREKKRQKKKEKQEREKEASKNSSPEPDENEIGEIKPEEIEEPPEPPVVEKPAPVTKAPVPALSLQTESQNINNKSHSSETVNNREATKSKNKKNKRQKERAPPVVTTASNTVINVPTPVTVMASRSATTVSSNTSSSNNTKASVNKINRENKKKTTVIKTVSTTGIGDLDDFGIPPNIPDLPFFPPKKEKVKNEKVNSRVSSLDTFDAPPLKLTPVKSAMSNNPCLRSPAVTPSPKKGQKREEGWKEVVRKSKKVNVPAAAISRVIGRGGCNINAIREVSGAHIEVDKQQKGTADRTITIRGSADATRQAHNLITALIKDPDRDLVEILPKMKVKPPSVNTMTIDTFVPPDTNTSNGTSEPIGTLQSKISPPVVTQVTVPAWGNPVPLLSQQPKPPTMLSSTVSPSKSPSKVSRQLFPMSTVQGTVSKGMASVTSSLSPPFTNTVFSSAPNTVPAANNMKMQPPQPIGPSSGWPNMPMVPPSSSSIAENSVPGPLLSNPFQNQVSSHMEYSPFMLRSVPGVFQGKREDDGRLNFAGAAASGVGPTPSISPGPMAMATDITNDHAFASRAPGYKMNGQRMSPQLMDNNWGRAPGSIGVMNMPNEFDQQHMNCVPGPAGSSMTSPVFVTSISPRSFTSTPSHISPRGLAMARDEYTKADQPMTLPTIESTLNPNAPNFMSRTGGFQFGAPRLINPSRLPAQFGGIPNPGHPSAFAPAQPGPIGRPRFPPQPGMAGFPMRSQIPGPDGFPMGGAVFPNQPQMVPRGAGVSPIPPGATVLSSLPGSSTKQENSSPRVSVAPSASPAPTPSNNKTPSPTDQSLYSALEERLFPRPIGTERAIKKPAVPGLRAMGDLSIWSFSSEGGSEWSTGASVASTLMSSVTPPPRNHTPEDRPASRSMMPTFLENQEGQNVDHLYQPGGLAYQGFSNGPASIMAGMSGDSMWSPQVPASEEAKKWNWNQPTPMQ